MGWSRLIGMTELERELELAERAEKLRRESERLTLIADQQTEKSPSATSEVQTDVDGIAIYVFFHFKKPTILEEKHPSETGTPTALQSEDKGAESVSDRETEESDSGDREVKSHSAFVVKNVFLGS